MKAKEIKLTLMIIMMISIAFSAVLINRERFINLTQMYPKKIFIVVQHNLDGSMYIESIYKSKNKAKEVIDKLIKKDGMGPYSFVEHELLDD